MRLTNSEAEAIREEVSRMDPEAELYLYGSRTDDSARGGDIDLLVVSDKLTFRDTLRLRIQILDRIGEQQLDLVTRRRTELNDAISTIAMETGQKL
jgi:predicted nucleotidyltransferase